VQAGIDPHAGEQPNHVLTPAEAERGRYHPRGGGNVELLYIKLGTARRDEVLRQTPECPGIGKGRVGIIHLKLATNTRWNRLE